MGETLHALTYVCLVVFMLAVVVKFLRYRNMPLHLRWELYPVAHEGRRVRHGGSILEEVDWWDKPREVSRASELGRMLPEMLFLQGLWEHNRRLWFRSFPFHFGLYCMIGFSGLLAAGAVLGISGVEVGRGGGLGGAVYHATAAVGFFGMILCGAGALGLLHRRLFDPELKDYTTAADRFNLVFIFSVVAVTFAGAVIDPGMNGFRAYVASLITFDVGHAPSSGVTAAAVALSSVLVAYIPLTHMSHFIVKWFSYHKVRWEDEPNVRGGRLEKRIGSVLNYPVSWSADHIGGDGRKTWAEVATEDVAAKK
ncbi:MAG: respiratory nitrate reductase subunit gamma [bacterium]